MIALKRRWDINRLTKGISPDVLKRAAISGVRHQGEQPSGCVLLYNHRVNNIAEPCLFKISMLIGVGLVDSLSKKASNA